MSWHLRLGRVSSLKHFHYVSVSSRLDQIRNVSARLMSWYLCLGQCLCLRKKCLDFMTGHHHLRVLASMKWNIAPCWVTLAQETVQLVNSTMSLRCSTSIISHVEWSWTFNTTSTVGLTMRSRRGKQWMSANLTMSCSLFIPSRNAMSCRVYHRFAKCESTCSRRTSR